MSTTIEPLKDFAATRSAGPRKRGGVTLVELMIAIAILTIGVTGLVQTFSIIQKALQLSKNRTLASNLAQEKMQILKQMTYYNVVVTTDPEHNTTDFPGQSIDFDPGYFPPEYVTEGGVVYTRYTYVQVVREDSGEIQALAPSIPDTGMKRIIVTVMWGGAAGDKRKVTLRTILANPETVMSNVVFNGKVKTPLSVGIPGALVSVVEGAGWSDTTNATGDYNISANPGTYTLMASARGYYTQLRSVVISAGATQTNDFTMVKIDSGTITGYPWVTDHLVISQVVGSTVDLAITPSFDQEYVEVFNPTTYTWTMNGNVGFKFRRSQDSSGKTVQINYLTTEIPAGGYFLFANTGTVVAGGDSVDADAVWSAGNPTSDFPYFAAQGNIIPVDEDGGGEGSGALEMSSMALGRVIDKVGWDKTGYPAPFYEGQAIVQAIGLSRDELYARLTSTADTGGVDWNYGPAYDSNNNSVDFYDYSGSIAAPPHASYSGARTVIAGTPAVGAVVSCSDGLSSSTEAVLCTNPSPNAQSYAYFSLVDVATGAWTVSIASSVYILEQGTVTIPSSGSVYTFASTATFLSQETRQGLITGRVTNALGAPLRDIIVTPGGAGSTSTAPDGRYRLWVSTGIVDVFANPVSGGQESYVTASSITIPVETGEVHSGVNFVLYQGARVSGFITRDGTNGLPGVAVAILDYNNVARDQQISGTDGRFTSVILSTGLYIAQPSLGALETSFPVSSTVTLATMGETHFSSTFTVSGALGRITGSVSSGGQPIKTGVLILVTTTTLIGTPPAPPDLSSSTLTGPPYYLVSSLENGTYTAEVRASTGYNVYAYYSTPAETTAAIIVSTASNIDVVAGQATGLNFSW
jgi:prepilin-type N-terminal cleavage/methylation domain-containing protein